MKNVLRNFRKQMYFTPKMEKDTVVKEFLSDGHKNVWDSIANNRIEDLLAGLRPREQNGNFISKFFQRNKPAKQNEKLFVILYELFADGKSNALEVEEFAIADMKSGSLFIDLPRLLFALELNGKYMAVEQLLCDKLFQYTETIVDEIREKANGYPAKSMNGGVWLAAMEMRSGFYYLSYYYKKNAFIEAQLWVEKMRTSITLSIMGHYKEEVGPDMITVADIEEQLGLREEALSHYKAVVADFDNELPFYIDNLGEDLEESDTKILRSLLSSYQGVDRINGTNSYEEQIRSIIQILS